ncbi:hypothetical protein ACSBR1_001216 [Camellia fascicularis]
MYNLHSIFLQLNLAWVLLVASFTAAQFVNGCQDYCGNISVPYPFGTSKECYVEEHFLVTCNDTHYDPPKLLGATPMQLSQAPRDRTEEAAYNFSSLDLANLQSRTMFPVVLDWSVGNQTCAEAKNNLTSFACKANSDCYDFDNGPGYRCNCPQGYEGNPYLPNGCIEGYEGDGRKNGSGCSLIPALNHRLPVINIALGISISISGLLLGGSWLYWVFRQRKIFNLREKFFQQNGGFMLKQQLSKCEGSVQSAKIFTSDDLKKATNNYDERCCLETQIPLLVYEFVTNGTLYEHIHNIDHNRSSITWENRLRIATETVAALSYLHSDASIPIIHRDVKSTNILLYDNYVAKVSNFGASRLIPIDQTQLTTLVQGTLGYLDLEYFHTSQLTGKSDVYSFGVVLVELLTGKKALSFNRPKLERNLAMSFVSSMKEDHFFEIVDE